MAFLGFGKKSVELEVPTSLFVEGEGEYHTVQNPYCPDWECWCRTDLSYHKQVTGAPTTEEYFAGGVSGFLLDEFDEDQYEYALSLLGSR
jgi:hypothetical protein